MSAANVPIFKGANNEKACMRVMSNLRFKGECLADLHNKINKSLELIEAMIVKNPSDDNKMLLLQTLELYERGKCVATWAEPVIKETYDPVTDSKTYDEDENGNPIYETLKNGKFKYEKGSNTRKINTTDWQVSITSKKTVRVHLKDEVIAQLTQYYNSRIKHIKDLKFY
jgi:hypothetical protein